MALGIMHFLVFSVLLFFGLTPLCRGQRSSCMSKWLSSVGIADKDALSYTISQRFTHMKGVSVRSLMVAPAEVLDYLNVSAHDRDLIVNCSRDRSCPPHQCQHGGRCEFSSTKGRFTCRCTQDWQGSRCTDVSYRGFPKKKLKRMLKKALSQVEQLNLELSQLNRTRDYMAAKLKKKALTVRDLTEKLETERRACQSYIAEGRKAKSLYQSCRAQLAYPFTRYGCGNGRNGLASGSVLGQERQLVSSNGRYHLTLDARDGLVAYDGQTAFWRAPLQRDSTVTNERGLRLEVLLNGNVQLVNSGGNILWQTMSGSGVGVREVCLLLENTKRLTLRGACGAVLWTSGAESNELFNGK